MTLQLVLNVNYYLSIIQNNSLDIFKISATEFTLSTRLNTPGPDKYRVEDYVQDKGPQFSLYSRPQSAQSQRLQESYPGPGSYNIPDSLNNTVKYSMRGRPNSGSSQRQKQEKQIGPESYNVNPDLFKSQTSCTFAGRTKLPQQIEQTPGPQKYHVEDSQHYGRTSSMYGRTKFGSMLQDVDKDKTVGPETYKVEDIKQHKDYSYTMRGRTKINSHRDETPGPGAYNIDRQPNHGVSFSMSGRTKYFGYTSDRK